MKKIRKLSNKQEQSIAKELNGKVTPASGATPFSKGDVRVNSAFRIECKFTLAETYTLKLDELIKIRNEAVRKLEIPLFQIDFKGTNKSKYMVVPLREIKEDTSSVTIITSYNKSLVLRSGDLLYHLSKNKEEKLPLLKIVFDRIPVIGKMEFGLYELTVYLKNLEKDDYESILSDLEMLDAKPRV
jgi:hypothetical protein